MGLLSRLHVPIGWGEVFKRTFQKMMADNVFGWAAELAYYFFLALFPALLFFVALASFFPIHDLTNQIVDSLARFAPGDVLVLVRDQLLQISKNNNGGLLTLGILGTIWSASSGMSAVISTLNQAYHVVEGRSWIRVRITAILLTIALAVFVLVSFALVLVGPTAADKVADMVNLGGALAWTWKILQWPVVVALMITGIAIVYYVAPDVKQEWKWITPGSVFATIIWLLISLGFKWYVTAFANYQKTYGAIGGVIVALLWFYVSGLAILMGAMMNASIEHASPEGKDPGEKVAGQKEREGIAATATEDVKRAEADAAAARSAARQPVRAPRTRPSELIVGAIGLSAELSAVVWSRIRSARQRV